MRQLKNDWRTNFAAPITASRPSQNIGLSQQKPAPRKGLRQCDSRKMSVAKLLSQVICVSATVPYVIGDRCSDRRSAALMQGRVTQMSLIPHGRFSSGVLR